MWFRQNLLVAVYGGNERSGTVELIPQLRWYMFSKYQAQIEKLPPTVAASKYKKKKKKKK